eukprot:18175-Amorphochlora_amoeboformis.AAC.2
MMVARHAHWSAGATKPLRMGAPSSSSGSAGEGGLFWSSGSKSVGRSSKSELRRNDVLGTKFEITIPSVMVTGISIKGNDHRAEWMSFRERPEAINPTSVPPRRKNQKKKVRACP